MATTPPRPRAKRKVAPPKAPRRSPPSDSTLRLPHEQDESADLQPQAPTQVKKNALDDLQSGQVDTDPRGNESRAAFDRQPDRSPQGPGTVEVAPSTPRTGRRRRGSS